LNGTHELLAYADDVDLLGDNIDVTNLKVAGSIPDEVNDFYQVT
jgi:hypothetical protein